MRHVARLLPEGVGSPARGLAPSVLCGALAGLAVVGQAALLSRALDAAFLGGAQSPITVELDGGELVVKITPELDLTLIGTASRVYGGELDPAFVIDERG